MKPWHKNYPENTDHVIDTRKYSSVVDLFNNTVNTYGDKPAFQSFGKELSFNDVKTLSGNFAAALQNTFSVNKGDRIAVMSPNCLPFIVAMWGILRTGAVQVNVNPLYTPRELEHQLNDAQVDTIIIFAASTPVLAEIVENTAVKNMIVIKLDDLLDLGLPDTDIDPRLSNCVLFSDVLAEGESLSLEEPNIEQSDLIFLQYTGGTTGLSKGAMLSHGNLVANILQFYEFVKTVLTDGEETIITAIPMYHIFALAVNGLCFFAVGARNVLITNPRDMDSFVQTWAKTSPTAFTGVNTLFNGLIHTPGFDEIDFSGLVLTCGGGAPVQQVVSDKWKAITGQRINEGYGLSETSPVLTLNLGVGDRYVPGIGIPLSSTDISLRDEDGNVVADGEAGELCAKGPQIMAGYWNNPEATANVMTSDGYFMTGDIAVLDSDGFFHIVDRKKDMILVSGFNVYPNEIEDVVATMPGILECACIGVPDTSSGEAVKVFAVRTDVEITPEDVTDFCRDSLTAYKVPKRVEFIDELPKSSVGKILRRELRG